MPGPSWSADSASNTKTTPKALTKQGAKANIKKFTKPNGGVLGDLQESISNIPRGIVGLGKGAVQEVKSSAHEWAHPKPVISRSGKVNIVPENLKSLARGFQGKSTPQDQAAHPLFTGQGQSFRTTYNRLSDPGKLLKDYSQRPFSALAEDAANLSVVAAPAARALEGVGLAKTAAGVTRAGEVLNKVGQGPFIATGPLARGANALIGKAGSKLGEVAGIGDHLANVRQVKDILRTTEDKIQKTVSPILRGEKKAMSKLKTPDEQAAAFEIGQQSLSPKVAAGLSKLREVDPVGFKTFTQDRMGLSEKAANLLVDATTGKNPEFLARAQEALAATAEGRATRQAGYLEGAPTRVEQLGSGPMPTEVAKATKKWEPLLEKAQKTAETARLKADLNQAKLNEVRSQGEFRTLPSVTERKAGEGPPIRAAAEPSKVLPKLASSRLRKIDIESAIRSKLEEQIPGQRFYVDASESGRPRIWSDTPLSVEAQKIVEEVRRVAADRNVVKEWLLASRPAPLAEPVIPSPAVADLGSRALQSPKFIRSDLTESQKLGESVQNQRILNRAAKKAETRVTRLEGRIETKRANAEYAVGSAPARLRPALEVARSVQSLLTEHENTLRLAGLPDAAAEIKKITDEIPTTTDLLAKEGISPDHFIHPPVKGEGKPRGSVTGNPSLPSRKRDLASYKRLPSELRYDRSIPAQARAEVARIRGVMEGQATKAVTDLPMAKGPLAFPSEEAAKAAGYTQYGPDGKYLPTPIVERFQKYWHPKDPNPAMKWTAGVYDGATKMFKLAVLPLSPSWQVGNIVGNLFQATVGGGVDPLTLAKNIATAIKEYRASGARGYRDWSAVAPSRLFTSGAVHDIGALDRMVPREAAATKLGRAGQKVGRALSLPARAGYAANEMVDNIGRSAVYLAKKGAGHSDELALREALRAMGDFTNMNALERNTIRRIVPFYAWQKHITTLAFTLPIEHPLRTAWTLSLANQYGQPDSYVRGLPDFMQGLLPLGGDSILSTSSLFPFPINPLENFSPQGALRNLNPILKGGIENSTGINTLTGQPFSRPAGTGKLEYGKPLPTAPSLLQQLAGISPQVRLVRGLNGYNDVARYSTGDKVLTTDKATGKRVTIPSGKPSGVWAALKFFGVNVQSKKQLQALAGSAAANRAAAAATAAKYAKARKPSKTSTGSGGKPSWAK